MIPRIKKILYATRLAEDTNGFAYAVDLAKRYDAGIIILHSIEPGHSLSYAGASVEAIMQSAKKQDQEASLEEVKTRITSVCEETEALLKTPCKTLVSKILIPFGNPVEEILKAADEEGCDIIILGTHRKGFFKQALLRSVAQAILDRTTIPVLFVPLRLAEANIE